MEVDTKIVFLGGLEAKISSVAILLLASKKIPQGCQAGIRLILSQEWSKMTNQP